MIVLVDDDPAVAHSTAFALEAEGLAIRVHGDAESLLRELEGTDGPGRIGEIACLILDYHLSGLDGLTLLVRLRAGGVTCPAILTTTHPPRRLREDVARSGAVLVEKPLIGDTLLGEVQKALAVRRCVSGPSRGPVPTGS